MTKLNKKAEVETNLGTMTAKTFALLHRGVLYLACLRLFAKVLSVFT